MGKFRKIIDERGSGVAIYIFTVFIIATVVLLMVALYSINKADSVKQRAQVLLFHALADAIHVTEIIPNYVNGRLVNNVYIPPSNALRSFCTTYGDGISVARIFDVQPRGSNCVGQLMPPNEGNTDFDKGILITDFVVINSIYDPAYTQIPVIRGKDFKPPFIYVRLEIPKTYRLRGMEYNYSFPIAAVYRPSLIDTKEGEFIIPSF